MAAKKKTASKKSAAALKKPAKAASKAKPTPRAKPKPVATTAKMAVAKSARGGTPEEKGKAAKASRAAKTAKTAGAAPRSTPKQSEVKGNTVDWYFDQAGGWQEEAMRRIHDIVLDT